MAINNPYIPGDPYSYDLKWIVAKVKEILLQLGTLDETIEKKIFESFLEHSIVQFHNVADMLAADIKDGSIVLTLGYYEAGDQGAMFYLIKDFNPGQCALDYFLTMDNNAQIAIPVIVTPYVTPQMFGAKADGTTNDHDAIQLALDNSFHVIMPNGNYYLEESVTIPEHCLMEGTGEAAIWRGANGFALIQMGDYTTVDNVIVYGKGNRNPYEDQNDREIAAIDCTGATIKNCHVYNADYAAIWAENAVNIVIDNNHVEHYGHAGILVRDASRNVKVTNNTVKYGDDVVTPNRYAIMLSTGETEKTIGCICTGNYVEDQTAYWEGIDAHCIEDAVISDNVIINCLTGISIVNRDSYPAVTSDNVVITGNSIEQKTDHNYGNNSCYGIVYQSAGTIPAVISGNTLKNTGMASTTPIDKGGIKVRGNAVVTGNTIHINDGRCFRLESTKNNGCVMNELLIQANMANANGGLGVDMYNSAATDIQGTIEGNTFMNCSTAFSGFTNYLETSYQPGVFAKNNELINVTNVITQNMHGAYCDLQTAYPAAGCGRKGAFVKNSAFNGSGIIGWICTADPVPGSTAAVWASVTV